MVPAAFPSSHVSLLPSFPPAQYWVQVVEVGIAEDERSGGIRVDEVGYQDYRVSVVWFSTT